MVAFDLDGTLIESDSFLLFAEHAVGKRRMARGLLRNLPGLLAWKLGLRDPAKVKEELFSSLYKGMTEKESGRLAEEFADILERHLRPEARRRLEEMGNEGEKGVIVSASPGFWIRPWAARRGLEVIATEAEWSSADGERRLTGAFATPNCKGEEKRRRLREHYGEGIKLDEAWGDSPEDIPMLNLAAKKEWFGKPGKGPR